MNVICLVGLQPTSIVTSELASLLGLKALFLFRYIHMAASLQAFRPEYIYYQHLDKESKKLLFTALLHPHLGFGNVVRAPRLQKDRLLIESVQRRATKLVPGPTEPDYSERLKSMDLPSMNYRRERGDIIETYKYTDGLYSVSNSLLKIDVETVTRGYKYKLKKLRCSTSLRQNHFCLQRRGQLELVAI